jgi:exodeoxyribonuclease-5
MMLSPKQQEADAAVCGWHRSSNEQIFRLFGPAGTGKTTLLQGFVSNMGVKVCYMAFTGKAAMVMRKSGCTGAATIHSVIYKATRNKKTGRMEFKLNKRALDDYDMIAVDEVSMVDDEIGNDLVSYGKPILVLGDPAQLPPVKGGGYFTNQEPDVMLTEIHRQAEGNPIIQLATTVRTGGTLELGQYGASRVITRKEIDAEAILAADQVLVGYNNSRHLYNARIRDLLGRKGWEPEVGERLVCLKNNKETGIFNGGLFDVQSVPPRTAYDKADRVIQLSIKSADFDDAPEIKTCVREEFLDGSGTKIHWKELIGTDQFDYGYALTVHKAQGSQWPEVVVFDESRVAKNEAWRWLYTAITRASEKITIVK